MFREHRLKSQPHCTWHNSHNALGTTATLHLAQQPHCTWHNSHTALGTTATLHFATLHFATLHFATLHLAQQPHCTWHNSHTAPGTTAILHLAQQPYCTWHNNHTALGTTAPKGTGPHHRRSFTITLRHTTVGITPLDGRSARRRDLYLTTQNTRKRQTSVPPAGFEPAISASERPQS